MFWNVLKRCSSYITGGWDKGFRFLIQFLLKIGSVMLLIMCFSIAVSLSLCHMHMCLEATYVNVCDYPRFQNFFQGCGFSLENGCSVLVVAKLEEVELATSPVPLTPQPRFEEEISWRISFSVLSKYVFRNFFVFVLLAMKTFVQCPATPM